MINIINTSSEISSLFENGAFNYEKWEIYINNIYENSAHIFADDISESGYDFFNDVLPVINAVNKNDNLIELKQSFSKATENINEKIYSCFNNYLDCDIVLYLGLANGAGWATQINGRDVILLGIEKIIELQWYDCNSMYGLIYHELGHIYHRQYGNLDQKSVSEADNFIFQLFTEGIAMYFEQRLADDIDYYHQDRDGWKEWCHKHFRELIIDFNNDLTVMNQRTQRYFGDWADYYGKADTGYYLGCEFVHFLISEKEFNQLIKLDIDEVCQLYKLFYDYNCEQFYIEAEDNQWPMTYIDHNRQIVRAVVFDREGYFYFVKADRDDDFDKACYIETSGGGVEKNEELISALKRELLEELGVEVEIIRKIGVVSDYYNLIHRHNINNYYLCHITAFGNRHLTADEINEYHLSTVKMTLSQAISEYEKNTDSKLGRLIASRELPVLKKVQELMNK